jgi:hypothetical protein
VLLEENVGVSNVTWFSDEAFFHLDVILTSKISDFGPQRTEGFPLPTHCIQRVTTRGPLSSDGIFGPVFIDGTVTSDLYLSLTSDEFIPFLMGYDVLVNSA